MVVCILLILHFISSLCLYIYFEKTGALERAAKYGDGIRTATPSDLIFDCVFASEIHWLIILIDFIDNSINSYFENRYR